MYEIDSNVLDSESEALSSVVIVLYAIEWVTTYADLAVC